MIDLCVVNYNTEDKLQRLYQTIHRSLGPLKSGKGIIPGKHMRLFIADNGSDEISFAKFLHKNTGVHVEFNRNIGYSAACNKLASQGEGDIIGLLNADVWFTIQDVIAIQQAFDEHPEMAIMGPKQRDEAGKITHAGVFGTETHPQMRGWHQPDPTDVLYRDYLEAITVAGSAYFIRRSVWGELTACPVHVQFHKERGLVGEGAFLQTPHYFEERACSAHARAHGYRVWYDGTISIGHSWHASHPIGSSHDQMFHVSKRMYQDFADMHGFEREP